MVSARGATRGWLLPILIACFSLFTAAGWAAPGEMAEVRAFAARAEISAAGDEHELTGSDDRAPHPVATDAQADSVAASGQFPPQQPIPAPEAPQSSTRRSAADPLPTQSAPPSDATNPAFGMQASAEAARLPIATLQFTRGSTSVARRDHAILRAVAALHARSGGRIEVVGHADRGNARGAAARHVNWLTAESRAAAVAEALVSLGLPPATISAEGRGDTQPRYAETTAAGAAANRRVEVYLLPAHASEPTAEPRSESAVTGELPAGTPSGAVPLEAGSAPSSHLASHTESGAAASITLAASGRTLPVQATAEVSADSGRIRVATLYFAHGSSRLGRRERAIIDAAAFFHRQHQGTVVIIGHASAGASSHDAESRNRANRTVSLARADAVARALAAEGVAAGQMSVAGRGADEPAFAEDNAAGIAGNRRVEIYVDLPVAVRLADRGQGLLR